MGRVSELVSSQLRPQRADARRNRERILAAARAVFAATGVEAQIDDVARRADVGVGTVYRHFPTKEALIEALVRDHFAILAGFAQEAEQAPDAWEGFCAMVWRCAELNATVRGFSQVMGSSDKREIVAECGLFAATSALMRRAQAEGSMRPDAGPEDVAVLMCGHAGVAATFPEPASWRRYLELMLDGLRAA